MADDANAVETLARSIATFGLEVASPTEPSEVSDPVWDAAARADPARAYDGSRGRERGGRRRSCSATSRRQLCSRSTVKRWRGAWSVERKLVGLADAFDADDIGFAVLKGPSVAHTMYPESCLRSFADLDLLVSSTDYERACALLRRLGHVRHQPEPRPGFDVRFGKASVHKHPEDGIEVDLHRTLVVGPFGLWIRPEELLERREPFLLAGRKLSRLDAHPCGIGVLSQPCELVQRTIPSVRDQFRSPSPFIVNWYGNINPFAIEYPFRVFLRSRLTLVCRTSIQETLVLRRYGF